MVVELTEIGFLARNLAAVARHLAAVARHLAAVARHLAVVARHLAVVARFPLHSVKLGKKWLLITLLPETQQDRTITLSCQHPQDKIGLEQEIQTSLI